MAEETRIIRIVIDSSKAVDGSAAATRALSNLERSQAHVATSLDRMEQSLGRVGGYLKAQLALAVAEVGARLIQMGRDAFNAAAGLGELAEQLGVSARYLQGAQYAAVQTGVKLEQLETAFGKFSQKMGEAADGSKDIIESLDRIGVKNLDLQGKLRPTEELMVDVAKAITAIEDPARRSAAAVDFFGKSGTRMLPMMGDIAKGYGSMAAAAERAGAVISDETIVKLDKLSDRMAVSKQEHLAFFAGLLGGAVDMLDKVDASMQGAANSINRWLKGAAALVGDWVDATLSGLDQVVIAGARFNAGFAEAIRSIPEALTRVFTDGINGAIEALETGLNKITGILADKAPWLGVKGGEISFGRIGGGSATGDRNAGIAAAENGAEAAMRAQGFGRDYAAERARQRIIDGQAGYASDEDAARGMKLGPSVAPGARTSAVKASGGNSEDAIAKLKRDTDRALASATALAGASEQGARAVADLEIHFKALDKAQDAWIKGNDKSKGSLEALTATIEAKMRAEEKAKTLGTFNLGTEEMEKANALMEAENRLINANAEDRAREIALIRLKNDIQSKGLDENNAKEKEAIDRRESAITQNELLKAQGAELQKANELWTEPLKTALSSIQTTAADAFEGMLNSGKINFQSLGDVFKKTVTRMIAEFMALQFVRPVMSVVVSALGGTGIVSPATASSLGFGGGPSISGGLGGGGISGISPMSFGGTGGFELPSWLGGGSISNLMAATPFASAAPAGGFASIEALMASGQAGSSAGLSAGGLMGGIQGLSVGSMLGAGVGIGMGAYSLFNAKGNTAKTIGGIGQIIGGGMMLIPGMQIPGMIVSVLSSILPSLFGGEEYKWPALAGANTRFDPSAGGYVQSGSQQNGGAGIDGQFSSVKTALDAIFKQTGGKLDPSKAFGGAVWNNQREGTTSTYIISPVVGSAQLSEAGGDPTKAVEAMIAKIFYNTATTKGALTGVSPTLTKALAGHEPTTLKEVDAVLSLVAAYDKLGETVSSMQKVMDDISASFVELTAGAEKFGLSLEPIKEQERKAKRAVYDEFVSGPETDPVKAATKTYNDAFKSIGETLKVFVDEAEALGLSADKIAADTLKVYHRVGDAYKKQVEEIEYNKAVASSNFTFGHANARLALTNPTQASMDAARRQMGFDYKAAMDMGGTPLEQQARGAEVFRTFNAQMQKMADDFISSMKRAYDGLLDPALASAAEAWEARKADLQKAMAIDGNFFDGILRVGPAMEAAAKFWNEKIFKTARDIQYGTEQALLAFTDPLQASLNALHKERDNALKEAAAANANVSNVLAEQYARAQALDEIRVNDQYAITYLIRDAAKANREMTEAEQKRIEGYRAEIGAAEAATAAMNRTFATQNAQYVELANITELYLKKEAALKEQYYAQSLGGLEALIKRLTFGDLSGASPTSMLAGTRGDYRATLSAAQSGDITSLQNLSGVADTYVQSARSYFTSSPEYYAIVKEVKDAITAIDVNLRGGNITPGGATGGNAIDAGAWAGIVTSLQEMVSTQNQQISVLREELGSTNALLRRQLLNA